MTRHRHQQPALPPEIGGFLGLLSPPQATFPNAKPVLAACTRVCEASMQPFDMPVFCLKRHICTWLNGMSAEHPTGSHAGANVPACSRQPVCSPYTFSTRHLRHIARMLEAMYSPCQYLRYNAFSVVVMDRTGSRHGRFSLDRRTWLAPPTPTPVGSAAVIRLGIGTGQWRSGHLRCIDAPWCFRW